MDFAPAASARWDVSLHSRDADEVRGYLDGNGFTLGIDARQAARLNMRTFGLRLPNIYIGYMQYGAPVTVRANPGRDDYWVLFPIRGNLDAYGRDYDLRCDPHQAVEVRRLSRGAGR